MISLTGFAEADKDVLFRWINDPGIVKFNAAFQPVSWDQHCEWWDTLNIDAGKRSFAIRAGKKLIGTVQLQDIHPVHRHAEVSIRIGEQSDRERGAGTQALQGIVKIAFKDLALERIFTHVWSDNARAIRAYEKAGFVHEGTMPRHVFIRGEWKDVAIMGIVR